jgi:uncharacterized cupin superfamily protein
VRANVYDPDFVDDHRAGFFRRRASVAHEAGAVDIGATVHELPPSETAYVHHFHYGNEEMMVVLSGRPSLRDDGDWEELEPGDVVGHPRGRAGIHQVTNRSTAPVRFLMLSEMRGPEIVVYPDSDKLGARPDAQAAWKPIELWRIFRAQDAAEDHFEGETPPSG